MSSPTSVGRFRFPVEVRVGPNERGDLSWWTVAARHGRGRLAGYAGRLAGRARPPGHSVGQVNNLVQSCRSPALTYGGMRL